MHRALLFALLTGALLSCRESGPEQSSVLGIWQLRTVNGRGLPAPAAALQGSVAGGILRLIPSSTWTEFCVDRGAGALVPLHHGGGFQELGSSRGLVLYYTSTGAGTIPPDTLIVSGDAATLHFRQGASVTDVLGLDRIAGAEMTAAETPSACP